MNEAIKSHTEAVHKVGGVTNSEHHNALSGIKNQMKDQSHQHNLFKHGAIGVGAGLVGMTALNRANKG